MLERVDSGGLVPTDPWVLRAGDDVGPRIFEALAADPSRIADDLSPERIASALDLACRPIQTLTPSGWSRLAPAMFALVALLRPRRFVELGSHHGLSFFAANQAMKTLDLPAEAIAIDTWEGDPQAGLYGEGVFRGFTEVLRAHYPERAHYIRARFDDARACFADGSIDLLHIDGLHTYDAVRHDFESWLPKLSDRGVVILHDTTVYEADFGVWRFWRDLSARYPALNVLHGHGLGIVYVGRPCRFGEVLREVAEDPHRYAAFNAFFRGVGDLSLTAAECRSAAAAGAAVPALERELSGARAVRALERDNAAIRAALETERAGRASLESQVAAMHSSTSWKISWPLRRLGNMLRKV